MLLPLVISFTGNNRIEFIYDATGAKLRKTTYANNTLQETRDYVNGVEYKNGAVDRFAHTEGAVVRNENGVFEHQYTIRDHLGNTRVTYRDGVNKVDNTGNTSYNDGIITVSDMMQINHYYPFGMNMEGNWNGSFPDAKNKYQYNGKELNSDFGLEWNDYGFRMYDAAIGRFPMVDPLSEIYDFQSPYVYAANNPINYIDFMGMGPFDSKGADGMTNSQWMASSNPANHGSEAASAAWRGYDKANEPQKKAVPYGVRTYQNGVLIGDRIDGYNWVDSDCDCGCPGKPPCNYQPAIKVFDGYDLGLGLHGYIMLGGESIVNSKRFSIVSQNLSGNPLSITSKLQGLRAFSIVSKYSFYTSIAFSGINAYYKIKSGEPVGGVLIKTTFDIGIGTIGYLGGSNPYTLAIGAGYFLIDKTVGWEEAMKNYVNYKKQNIQIGLSIEKY